MASEGSKLGRLKLGELDSELRRGTAGSGRVPCRHRDGPGSRRPSRLLLRNAIARTQAREYRTALMRLGGNASAARRRLTAARPIGGARGRWRITYESSTTDSATSQSNGSTLRTVVAIQPSLLRSETGVVRSGCRPAQVADVGFSAVKRECRRTVRDNGSQEARPGGSGEPLGAARDAPAGRSLSHSPSEPSVRASVSESSRALAPRPRESEGLEKDRSLTFSAAEHSRNAPARISDRRARPARTGNGAVSPPAVGSLLVVGVAKAVSGRVAVRAAELHIQRRARGVVRTGR